MKVKTLNASFKRMRQKGIITPPLQVTDMVVRSVKTIYHKNLENLEKEILNKLKEYNVNKEKKTVLVKDSLEGLIQSLEAGEWLDVLVGVGFYNQLRKRLRTQFNKNTQHFFKELMEDADDKLLTRLTLNYRIDKNDVFQSRIERLRDSYIDNAVERISGEQNELKKTFLSKLTNWIEGKEDKLDIKDVLTQMKQTSVSEARFFARDQFCKFNKSLLIASFKEAGATKVKLVTCRDAAVRQKHKEWHNKTYAIDNIPIEWWTDYNCRCSAVPIWV